MIGRYSRRLPDYGNTTFKIIHRGFLNVTEWKPHITLDLLLRNSEPTNNRTY